MIKNYNQTNYSPCSTLTFLITVKASELALAKSASWKALSAVLSETLTSEKSTLYWLA